MPELLYHLCRLFADDSKIIAIIKNAHDTERLQLDLDQLGNWAKTWRNGTMTNVKSCILGKKQG